MKNKQLRIGIVFVVSLVILAYFILKTESLFSLFSSHKNYVVYARFSDVSGLFKSSPVRLAGVKIGLVEDIYLEKDRAVVKMFINDKYSLTTDARAKTSSIGIVGENYVELVYRKAHKTKKPTVIQDGGEILTLDPFDLNKAVTRFNDISEKVEGVVAALHDILADPASKDSLKTAMANLKIISRNLKDFSGAEGGMVKAVDSLKGLENKLTRTLNSLDRFIGRLEGSFYNEETGILKNIEQTSDKIKAIVEDFNQISQQIKKGKGTVGKILQDDALYQRVEESVDSLKKILQGVEETKKDLDQTKTNFYAGAEYFTELEKTRFSFGLDLNFANFSLMTRVKEEPVDGDPRFTALLGKNFSFITVGAGMLDSGLGAAAYFKFFNKRLQFGVEASRFYDKSYPFLRTVLTFSLAKHVRLLAGYEDLLDGEKRRFLLGFSLSN